MRNMCMKYFVQLQQYIVELFVFKNFCMSEIRTVRFCQLVSGYRLNMFRTSWTLHKGIFYFRLSYMCAFNNSSIFSPPRELTLQLGFALFQME